MANMMDLFKTIILVQLFFATSMTILTYALPTESLAYVDVFQNTADNISLTGVSNDVQDTLTRQQNIPIVDVGALLFYSGNILIDLMLNFIFAIPSMITLLLNGIMLIFPFDTFIVSRVAIFSSVIVTVMYIIGTIQILTAVRAGRVV